jgi:[NiFe] hydrogenase diaphorase moiety large subunit
MIATNHTNKLTYSTIRPKIGLTSALSKTPVDVVNDISASQLKGRGGAGFPTGIKWKFAANSSGEIKYVICNADEGEPGTFKDRLILSDYADLVFEGMTIGAYAIGSTIGLLYLRGEYAYMRPHLEKVLADRRKNGMLGKDICGKKGFDFDIEIRMGSGAYVCGEETALIESLEGHRGEPRNRPPFPVDTGFFDQPSIVNNVETFAWVTCICAKGAAWFKGIGTEKSAGPKIFSISGDCAKPGVYEFPLGISIAQLLKEVGGIDAKAVQVGGASGICIPASEFNRKIAFEDVPTGGSIIVFGQHRDMLEVAKNFMEFFVEESCGQCTPCRDGNAVILKGIEMLEQGECTTKYLDELCALGETMQLVSKCGLGQSSPNAFISIVKHFKNELMGRAPQCACHER